ncbi:hypothetical protein BCR36DRAFT_408829 [Piromyces finnis]|uniref:Uncharacterized protein n=1 Tax=Piromyces finnis TaxID=1754191 RepID=A0A1Y1VN50_9FUNG|nr:hypothetical protein BCR36DRAFT_408829 [Piromyces finnis]|eukprot:ORX59334.1 hypothetical protein BCR36DRAFT_408829 [Piromyces finnis]
MRLRSKGNTYAHDDFCVSDNEYEDSLNNTQNIEEVIIDSSQDQYFNNKKDDEIKYQEQLLNNSYSQESVIQKRNKKKRKNVILENSYDSEENNDNESSFENEGKEDEYNNDNIILINSNNNFSNDKNNDVNKNNNDMFNDLEMFSSSPVLPSIDTCMDKLFSNYSTPKKNKNDLEKSKNYSDNLNSKNSLSNRNKALKEKNNKKTVDTLKNSQSDPLNLFSNDFVDLISSQEVQNQKSELDPKNIKIPNLIKINDEFTIDENLLGIKKKNNTINKFSNINDNLFDDVSLENQKHDNKPKDDFSDKVGQPISILFSNSINDASNHKLSINFSKSKGKSSTVDTNKKQKEKFDNKGTSSNNNNDNVILMSDNNDDLDDLLNLFSNDIKDSSDIESDGEFIMSSNNGNGNKIKVKDLYTNNSITKNNKDKMILDSSNNMKGNSDDTDANDDDNDDNVICNFDFVDSKEKEKAEIESKLIQLFDNDEIDNEMNYERDDDFFDEQQKKYYKQASIKELINRKKSKKDALINLFMSEDEEEKKLSKGNKVKVNNTLDMNIFNSSNKEKKSLSLTRSHPRKTKLDFYFKELPSSSTSTTINLPKSSNAKTSNGGLIEKESPLFYNISKGNKRTYEEDKIVKNPFIISKKQKLEEKIIADKHNENNQLNNVLLKFESNEKSKPKTSLFHKSTSNKKQKKQVSLLSLFASQTNDKNQKVDSPIKCNEYNSIITKITEPKKDQYHDFHKAKSTNSKVRIRNRQDRLSIEKINYIKPLVYTLTCEKKNVLNYHNPNCNKRGINHPKPISIYDCQEIKHSFRPSNYNNNNNNGMNTSINDDYDLMKKNLIKKKEDSLVNAFITSFETKNDTFDNKKNVIWPPMGWNNYFQNSIANSF